MFPISNVVFTGQNLSYQKFFSTSKVKESIKKEKMINILNVAEKNDAAKNLANIMSRGGFTKVCYFFM